MAKNKKEFSYEIIEHIATLSRNEETNFTTELNVISYNGLEPKYDLRHWNRNKDRLLKGITLTEEEAQELKKALDKCM